MTTRAPSCRKHPAATRTGGSYGDGGWGRLRAGKNMKRKIWGACRHTSGFLFAAIVIASTGISEAATSPSPVAVLTLVPQKADQYAIAPTASEVAGLTAQIRSGLASPSMRLVLLPQSRVSGAPCADVGCARRIGQTLGARTVVFGSAIRLIGIQWTVQVSAVQVSSGRLIDTLSYGVLGDYDSLRNGVRQAGVCLGRSISAETHCKTESSAT